MASVKKDSNVLWINAFHNPYKFWRTPIKWTKCFFRSFSIARDRIVRGWSPYDVWDLDVYVNQILGQGLEYLADNHMAYPGNDRFPTPESWEEWLRMTAKAFQNGNKENDEDNPYADRYLKYIEAGHYKDTKDGIEWHDACPIELQENYWQTDKTIGERKAADIKLALRELGEYWGCLWD